MEFNTPEIYYALFFWAAGAPIVVFQNSTFIAKTCAQISTLGCYPWPSVAGDGTR